MKFRSLFLILVFACVVSSASAGEKHGEFVADLVYAYNAPAPTTSDKRLSFEMVERLRKAFGYKYARLAQQARSPIDKVKSDFPPLGKEFSLEIHQLDNTDDGQKLRIYFYHANKCIVETTVNFKNGTPLFIKGPKYDNGLLVLVITADGVPKSDAK